jgi:hypothetical protein
MKVRCKICGAWSDDIAPGKDSFNVHYPPGMSWYGPRYSPQRRYGFKHSRLSDCPLTRGIKSAQILTDKDIEVV